MTSSEPRATRPSHWLPIYLGSLLLAACLLIIGLIYQDFKEQSSHAQYQANEIARLTDIKHKYESLLNLEPCAARKAYANFPGVKMPPPIPDASPESASATPGSAHPSSGAVEDVEAGCVFLVAPNGKSLMTGSGFFITPQYVLTNRHVVEKGNGRVLVTSKAMGEPVEGKVVALGSGNLDCAIVEVPVPENAHISVLPFAETVKKTQKIGAWGFPDLVGKNDPAYASLLKGENIRATPELSYSEGVVSAILEREPHLIVHTAPISPGNSGGPLVNEDGKVTGINTLITLDEDSYRQASIAIAGDDIKKFLTSRGIKFSTENTAKTE